MKRLIKQLMNWIRTSIQRRLFLYFIILVVPALILLGVTFYTIAAANMARNIDQYSEQILAQAILHLELYLKDYEQNTLAALGEQFVIEFLSEEHKDVYKLYQCAQYIRRTLFNPILSERAEVEGVFLVGLNGLALTAGTRATRYGLFDGLALLSSTAWWDLLPPDGTMLISGVHRQTYAGNLSVITLARRIVHPDNPSRTLGVFWVDIGLDRLADIARQVHLGRTGYLCILNSEGQVVYHPKTGLIGKPLQLPFLDRLKNGDGHRFLARVNEAEVLYLARRSRLTEWYLLAVVPYHEIAGEITQLKYLTILIVLVFLAVALAVSARFSISITRPIKKLEEMMHEAARGDLEGTLPIARDDEIGRLTMSFNRMLKRIQTLIDDICNSRLNELEAEYGQREAELKALQAQINPHFLFNTLSIINSLAVIEGVDSITQVVTNLRDFFRYTIITDQSTVTLGEEIDHIKRYMTIQRIRFGERIEFEVQVPVDLLRRPIIKLILQPLVENACLHGLELHSGRGGKIKVSARLSEGFLLLEVADNGVGMSRERLSEIRAVLEGRIPCAARYIGLRNVHERIRLRYGKAFGLQLESVEGHGTIVTVRLPDEETGSQLNGRSPKEGGDLK